MLKKNTLFISVIVAILLGVVLMGGCSQQAEDSKDNALMETGHIILRVNPEISVHYNKEGLVTKLVGENDDGVRVVEDYKDYIGKHVREAVKELVAEINDKGYFVSEVDGSTRSIVIQIEPGSVLPEERFFENLTADVQNTVKTMKIESGIIGIGLDDYDDTHRNTDKAQANASHIISKNKAKQIALNHAELKESDVSFVKIELDEDDGRYEYEVEFYKDQAEYDYEIDAHTGRILEFDYEIDDDDYRSQKNIGNQTTSSSAKPVTSGQLISKDEAVNIALKHAGVNKANARLDDIELDRDDGRMEYEIEFYADGYEYEYEIDAASGKIISVEKERDDDDDDDWDDDWDD